VTKIDNEFWQITIALNDRPIGNMIFDNEADYLEFYRCYKPLLDATDKRVIANKWGCITNVVVVENDDVIISQKSN
jgi:hypothetical protein